MLQCSRSPDPVKTDNSCNSCKRLQHALSGNHKPTGDGRSSSRQARSRSRLYLEVCHNLSTSKRDRTQQESLPKYFGRSAISFRATPSKTSRFQMRPRPRRSSQYLRISSHFPRSCASDCLAKVFMALSILSCFLLACSNGPAFGGLRLSYNVPSKPVWPTSFRSGF